MVDFKKYVKKNKNKQEESEKAQTPQVKSLNGKVVKSFYSKPDFSAGVLKTDSNEQVRFSGKVYLKEGDTVEVTGVWTKDAKYGLGFLVSSFKYNQDLSISGIANYLVSCKIPGLGRIKANKIAEKFKDNFEKTLLEQPATISSLVNINLSDVEELAKDWVNKRDYAALYGKLSGAGISPGAANKLITAYGASIVNILQETPYMLIGKVAGFGFKKIDAYARNLGIKKEDPGRINACLLYLLTENEDKGNTWYDRKQLIDDANKYLVMDCLNSKELIAEQIDKLKEDSRVRFYKRIYDGDTISYENTFLEEQGLFNRFQRVNDNPVFEGVSKDELYSLLNEPPYNFSNAKQKDALKNFIDYGQSVIAGIAGAGKSWTIGNIVKLCQKYNIPFVLCCPTGKAAKRLEQFTGIQAYTIHRLLGSNGFSFTYNNSAFYNARVIIIDEIGMVPTDLLWALYREVDFSKTAIVLCGDYNQLPCIGKGNVLKDILNKKLLPATILDQCMRQAGELKENCNKILEGTVLPTSESFIGTTNLKPWYKITKFSTDGEIKKYIEEVYKNSLTEKLGLDVIKDVQLLTPTHKGELGTVVLNKLVQSVVQKKLYNVDVYPDKDRFYVFDKVIQTRNNYDLGVMNGTIGVITKYENFNSLWVTFEDREIYYKDEDVDDLKLSYALSFHKCQGDEFPFVITIIHKSHNFMHSKNLFYTGVTRARKSVVIIGDSWGITNCAKKPDITERNTFLKVLK